MKLLHALTTIFLLMICRIDTVLAQESYNDRVLDSLLRELRIAKDDTNKTKLYYKVADRYGLHDPAKLREYVLLGKEHAQKHRFHRAEAVFVGMLGNIKHDQGDADSALWYYNKSYEMHEKAGEERNMALTLVDMSNVYNWNGNGVEAVRLLTRAIPILEKIKDYENLVVVYDNFASQYFAEENFEKALDYQLRALKAANKGKVEHYYGKIYRSLGNIYAGMKDSVRAEKFIRQSIGFSKKHHRHYDLAVAYMNLADYTTEHQQALNYLLEANTIFRQISPEHPVATSVIGRIGQLYLTKAIDGKQAISPLNDVERKRLLNQAERYIDTALTISKKNGYTQNVMYYTGMMAELKAEQGDYKQAYEDFTDHLALYDSLYSQENKNKISQIESENEILVRDQKIVEKETRIREMWLYGVIVLIGVLLLFSFFLYRSRIGNLHLKNSLIRQEAKQREAELHLQNRIMESELKVMRTQMNPHFIFNVLNNIDSYILSNDRKTASRLIQKFAKLSRLVLENSTHNLVPTTRDWQALQLYVELEALRFKDQFTYHFQVEEGVDIANLLIPPMLIQPIVENAIHHGLRAVEKSDKRLEVNLGVEDHYLVFTVVDNGVGFSHSARHSEIKVSYKEKSMGLASIKERLELFNLQQSTYKASLVIQDRETDSEGTIVRLTFPLLYEAIS